MVKEGKLFIIVIIIIINHYFHYVRFNLMKKDILELNCFKTRSEQFPNLLTFNFLFIGNLANTLYSPVEEVAQTYKLKIKDSYLSCALNDPLGKPVW